MRKIISSLLALVFCYIASLTIASPALAAGTVTATVLSPQGDAASSAAYTFTQGGTSVTGTTNSSGAISQSLDAGTWSLSITPPSSVKYADTFTLSTIVVTDSVTLALGNLYFRFQVPSGTDSDLESFGSAPSQCTQSGTPKIIRAYFEDEAKGSFLFAGRSANVIVVTDSASNTVTVDYSLYEGNSIGTNVETAVSQGGGKFKATHTIQNTSMGGGMPIISATRSSSTTGFCLSGGPVNLDIRTFINGSETTNFATVTDFRAIPNFTMHQSNVYKITFSRAVNMLDPTVQRFMRSLGSKLSGSTGTLSLDAKAVLDLKNAGATLTMYGISLNSPKIQVDGADDTSGVTSSITYDRSAKTLTFNAAHFTTFTAIESSSSSGVSTTSAPGCGDLAPTNNPHLFQIDTKTTSATLYFTPVNQHLTYYYIAYGLRPGDERYGVQFPHGLYNGVISYTINHLTPNTSYYFKVRGGAGCASGGWSNILSARSAGFIIASPQGTIQNNTKSQGVKKKNSRTKRPVPHKTKQKIAQKK